MGNIPCKHLPVVHDQTVDDVDEELIDKEVRKQIDAAYAALQKAENCTSLLKRHLTKEVFDIAKKKSTLYGGTLLDVIQSGVRNLDSEVGVYAPDAEAYTVFAPLLDRVIEDYHGGFSSIDRHPPCNYGDPSTVGKLDPEGRFVLSLRLRCARSIQGYPLSSLLTRDQRSGIESRLFTTLGRLQGEVAGEYYPFAMMPEDVQKRLAEEDALPGDCSRFLLAANACRDWPAGRGVFFNNDRSFLIWVNGADHVRIISRENGGDMSSAYGRLVEGLKQLEGMISFSKSSRLGFITFSPTELGSALRVSARLCLARLASEPKKMTSTALKLKLTIKGTDGGDRIQGGVVDVSNRRTLGISEIDTVREVINGVTELIRVEKFS